MVYHRTGTDCLYVAVPTPHGRVKRSTGTSHRPTAKAMARMLHELGPKGRRAWDLLEMVAKGSLTVPALFDAYSRNDLDGLRARLDDVDLAAHIPAWTAWLADRVKPNTADHYVAHLRSLMPDGKPYLRSSFTAPAVFVWIECM